MKNNANEQKTRPTADQLRQEVQRLRYRRRFRRALWSTISVFCVVAVLAVGFSLYCPVLWVHGDSMLPVLADGDIVVAIKDTRIIPGEMIAFTSEGKILVKRVVGVPGDEITVCLDGRVLVNGKILEEAYLTEKAYGECDIEYPFVVPENSAFVLGDNRSMSVASRSSAVGCIPQEKIIGRIMACVWPFKNIEIVTKGLYIGGED